MKQITLTTEAVRKMDQLAETKYGIPTLLLMENAGIQLAKHIEMQLIPPIQQCKIVMFCGTGMNGGDAFVAARHLFQRGIRSHIFVAGNVNQIQKDALVNFQIVKNLGLSIDSIGEFETKKRAYQGLPILAVDALIGTGFKPPLRDQMKQAIKTINDLKKMHNVSVKILAVDIPSGLNGDEGPQGQDIVKADMTVTFSCFKPGLLKPESKLFTGRLEVVDVGIPQALLNSN